MLDSGASGGGGSADDEGARAASATGSRRDAEHERGAQEAELTAGLESAGVAEIGGAIDRAVAGSAQMLGVDLGSLFEVRGAAIELTASHGERRPSDESRWPTSINEAVARLPWLSNRFVAGECVCIPEIGALADEAAAERAMFAAADVRSILLLPLFAEQEILAILVFERIGHRAQWSAAQISVTERIGSAIAGALGRQRLEDAHSATENRFRALTENAAELICELDVFGRYRYVSKSYTELLGYEPEELIGKSSAGIVHPDDQDGAVERFVAALEGHRDSCVVQRLRHRDGSWRWFDNTGRAYQSPSGELRFVSVGRDITERRKIERALERKLVLERHVAAVSRRLLDAEEQDVDETIRSALEETCELIEADRGCLVSYLEPNAEQCFVHNHACSTPPRLEASAWAKRQIDDSELLNCPDLRALPPDDRKGYEARGVRSVVALPVHASGTLAALLSFERTQKAAAFAEEQVTALEVVGQLFVSALRRCAAARELRASHTQLVQSQKIEAVGRLAGGIAHDFNNLLTVILGFARPMLGELEPGAELHEDVQQICGAAERAASLTARLLSFSRGQALSSQQVDLNSVVFELGDMLQRLLEEDIELAIELSDEECLVDGDANALEQVLVNLSVNARDAMPDGGSLTIRTRPLQLDARERRRLGLPPQESRGPARFVALEVEDSGSGMAAPVQQHLFEPFFTTKDLGKGTGLGLSIVYSVVKQAKGAISVASQEGKGSLFTIYLPASQLAENAEVPTPRQRSFRGDETLLLVEDETAVRQLIRRTLEAAGYRVVVAKNGQEALGVLATVRRIDGLVTDVVMPRMGGVELAHRLRAERPSLPVLYISGYAPERSQSATDAAQVGSDFLAKPFSAQQLLGRIRSALDAGGE